jgi:hypothetical protein
MEYMLTYKSSTERLVDLEEGTLYIVPHTKHFIVCRLGSIFFVFNPDKNITATYSCYAGPVPELLQTVYKTDVTMSDISAGLSKLLKTGD